MTRKAPAFQFYVDDFLSGTIDMSAEEVGVYIRLLCIQWSKGYVSQNDVDSYGGCPKVTKYVIEEKFLSINGVFVNQKLEKVRNLGRADLSSSAWRKIRIIVLEQNAWTCFYCGKEVHGSLATVDHVVPVSKGGTMDIDNLRAACRSCNSRKGDRYG